MELQDKQLRCVDCGVEFVWTAGEQLFFADKHFKNEPKRCKACKATRASQLATGMPEHQRLETHTTCSACGKATTVPFRSDRHRAARYSVGSASSSPRPVCDWRE